MYNNLIFSNMAKIELFSEDGITSVPAVKSSAKDKQRYRKRIRQGLYIDLFEGLKLESEFGIPVVSAYNGPLPEEWMPFCKRNVTSSAGIHFFSNDYTFNSVLTSPGRYVEDLRKHEAIIAPDASQYMNMPPCVRFTNSYTNKAIAAYWQSEGLSVIPNVTWSDPDSYAYSVAGLPQRSIIAINSMGAMKYNISKYLWQRGYDYVVSYLQPALILRFGPKMPLENEANSIYIESEHLNRMRYGR